MNRSRKQEAVFEAENVILTFMNKIVVNTSKYSKLNIKGGYLVHILGFKVIERHRRKRPKAKHVNI